MESKLIKSILANKDWIFSGIGVFILSLFIAGIFRIFKCQSTKKKSIKIQPKTSDNLFSTTPHLSKEAQYLLKETALTSDATFIKKDTSIIKSNKEVITTFITPRDKARWHEAMCELDRNGLIGEKIFSGSGNQMSLNDAGFKIADTINEKLNTNQALPIYGDNARL